MKKNLLFSLVFFTLLAPGVYSFQWPVEQVILKQTFGEPGDSEFNTGVALAGGRQAVRPVESGTVLFYFRDDDANPLIPSGLGNFVVVEHERSLHSIYSHLESDGGVFADPEKFTGLGKGDILGWVGSSGDVPGRQLNLEIVDLEFNQMVNPLKILPPLPDSTRPVIEDVFIRKGGWEVLSDGMTLPAGEQDLYISAYDQSDGIRYFSPMAPFKVNVFANGEEIFFQTFEAIESRKGTLFLVSRQVSRSYRELYADDRTMKVGKLNLSPGETSLEIIVSDYRGNRVLRNLKLRVLAGS